MIKLTRVVLFLITAANPCIADVDQIRYWGGTEARNIYETAVLKRALEATKADFGDYHFTLVTAHYGTHRGRRMIESGDVINMYASPPRPPEITAKENIITIAKPLLKGLLGYRRLIVNREALPSFKAIRTREQLAKKTAGQGRHWLDAALLRYNHFKVTDTSGYEHLFPMLARHRYDYLPLGAQEIEQALETNAQAYPDLVIEPDIIIYYPWPVVFQVSGKYPQLARRVEIGLERIIADKELATLFEHQYAELLQTLRRPSMRVFLLENPYMQTPEFRPYAALKTPKLLTNVKQRVQPK